MYLKTTLNCLKKIYAKVYYALYGYCIRVKRSCPDKHFPVWIQQKKHKKMVWIMFRVNNKDIRTFIAQKMKFSVKNFFSKYDQIRSFLRIWSHLLKVSLMENFFFLCSDQNDVDFECLPCLLWKNKYLLGRYKKFTQLLLVYLNNAMHQILSTTI